MILIGELHTEKAFRANARSGLFYLHPFQQQAFVGLSGKKSFSTEQGEDYFMILMAGASHRKSLAALTRGGLFHDPRGGSFTPKKPSAQMRGQGFFISIPSNSRLLSGCQ